MTRAEIERKLLEAKQFVTSKIEAQPVPAFIAGLVLGALIARVEQLIVVLFLAAVALGILWFLSEHSEGSSTTKEESITITTTPPSAESKTNGKAPNSTAEGTADRTTSIT